MIAALVSRLLVRHLSTAFRRICWVGGAPAWRADRPVVLYTNHHHFFDGHVLWYALAQGLERSVSLWMEEWDRFPLFAPCGALPFPRDAPARRASTFRRTAERFRTNPHSALIYFPEGTLHTPEEGVLPFDARSFQRLDRILPDKLWVPAALHYTWWGESLPTVLLYPGTPHLEATGDERDRLRALLAELRSAPPRHTELLFEGRRGPNEQRDLARTRAFFRRYL